MEELNAKIEKRAMEFIVRHGLLEQFNAENEMQMNARQIADSLGMTDEEFFEYLEQGKNSGGSHTIKEVFSKYGV